MVRGKEHQRLTKIVPCGTCREPCKSTIDIPAWCDNCWMQFTNRPNVPELKMMLSTPGPPTPYGYEATMCTMKICFEGCGTAFTPIKVEVDSIRALEAHMTGYQVLTLQTIMESVDIFTITPEVRQARNGFFYTYEEFVGYYGNTVEWKAAKTLNTIICEVAEATRKNSLTAEQHMAELLASEPIKLVAASKREKKRVRFQKRVRKIKTVWQRFAHLTLKNHVNFIAFSETEKELKPWRSTVGCGRPCRGQPPLLELDPCSFVFILDETDLVHSRSQPMDRCCDCFIPANLVYYNAEACHY